MRIKIDPDSGTPVYQQIVDAVVRQIESGTLPVGSRLPTVRALSADLDVAVNTAAKAYKQLESEGHVETLGRRGTVVRPSAVSGPDLLNAVDAVRKAARGAGLGLEETIGLLRRRW